MRVHPDHNLTQFTINLLGHGCLILAKGLEYFKTIRLVGRPFPEG